MIRALARDEIAEIEAQSRECKLCFGHLFASDITTRIRMESNLMRTLDRFPRSLRIVEAEMHEAERDEDA